MPLICPSQNDTALVKSEADDDSLSQILPFEKEVLQTFIRELRCVPIITVWVYREAYYN